MSEKKEKPQNEKAEDLPWYAALVNHVLTPGTALTKDVWTIFNIICGILFLIWILFLFNFPTNIHVWIFGGLCVGLTAATNWFMYEVFSAKQDFESREKAKQLEAEDPDNQAGEKSVTAKKND